MRILIAILLACSPIMGILANNHEYTQLVSEGMKALQEDSLSKAEGLFLKAITLKPAEKTNAVVYQYIGQLRVRQKRHMEALEAFNDGLSLEPVSQSILMDRASLNIELGRLNHALNDLSDILTLNPKHIEALFFRAYVYAEQHLNTKARIDYEQLLLLKPDHRQGRLGLALLCDKDNRPREAMEHIDVLLRYWPDDATVYAIRGGMY
ncbi:MAG: tetratricopeptide repeat protein, partial [Bacteroidaceae bacterium]|nr:tetratricopeptide repeat protein [Bacteroidaceae bacterium]